MRLARLRPDAGWAFRLVILGGALAMLAASMPGQLSTDSVVQLYEGRHHVRESFGPVVYSAILGGFDRLWPGTGLYLIASAALGFGTFLALRSLRPRVSWLAPLVALAAVLSPVLMIYQGEVWKDVLFANLSVASFVLLGAMARDWGRGGRRPWLGLAALVLMLALAAQVRQNGLIAALFAALVLAWTARAGGWRAVAGWSLGLLVAVVVASHALALAAQPPKAGPDQATSTGLRILIHYDIIGVVAHDKTLPLDDIRAVSPLVEHVIRDRGVPLYSPERVDYLDLDPGVGAALWLLPQDVVERQWVHLVLRSPGAYLAHRWDVFRWIFLTPMIDSCLPLYVGVAGPDAKLADLRIPAGLDRADTRLYNYGTWMLDTPAFSHLAYALACVGTAILLLLRREPQDMAMAGLMLAALGFAASFFLISIACDYRYLYFLDLAGLAGLVYLAIDPPLASRRS